MGNTNLKQAKKNKNDEFYKQLCDIEEELRHYKDFFKGKVVLCNCDDPRVSNFFNYFSYNFEYLGLKKLITTCYKNQDMDLFSQNKSEQAVYLEYTGEKNGGLVPTAEAIGIKQLQGDGDFRSDECVALLKQADIVVTNPPFSLFREYVAQRVEYNKKFIIIGKMNALTYKEIFKLIKENKMWSGFNFNKSMIFKTNYTNNVDSNRKYVQSKGYNPDENYIATPAVCWFSNMEITKRHEKLDLYKKYTPEEYPKYDNYDAINVDKVSDIPIDYDGVMGVPITFLDKYNPDQFEIIGLLNSSDTELAGIPATREYNDFKEIRQDGTFTKATGRKTKGNPVLAGKSLKGNYYINPNTKECVYSTYARILIKKKGSTNEN